MKTVAFIVTLCQMFLSSCVLNGSCFCDLNNHGTVWLACGEDEALFFYCTERHFKAPAVRRRTFTPAVKERLAGSLSALSDYRKKKKSPKVTARANLFSNTPSLLLWPPCLGIHTLIKEMGFHPLCRVSSNGVPSHLVCCGSPWARGSRLMDGWTMIKFRAGQRHTNSKTESPICSPILPPK